MLRDSIRSKSIIISTHEFASGFPQYMEEYLFQNKIKNLLYIHHPLHLDQKDGSGFRIYSNGSLIKEKKDIYKTKISVITFFLDFLSNIYWVLKTKKRWDLYVGSNNLNAFSGLFLKKLGLVSKCVFYTVDFIPNRFSRPLLNKVYLWIDGFCTKHCDETWILSPRVIEGRHEYLKLDKKYDKKQILVPEGVWLSRIKRKTFSDINKTRAVFVGHLVERMGVQKVIEAIPQIVKKIPNFKLIIIGTGDYKDRLRKLAEDLRVTDKVVFTGYIGDHKNVEDLIASCAVGIACYKKDDGSFTYYAEPSKTKVYLGAGIPVVMTDMFYNAYDIEKAGAGKVVEYDEKSIAKAIISVLSNANKLENYRNEALEFIKDYDWVKIFEKNLSRILKQRP